jgi:2'-5' RNA ligase
MYFPMRLFIAVNFSDEVKSRLLKIREHLKSQSSRGNFTRPENLHLTLVFLGETPAEKLEKLYDTLEGIQSSPFVIPFNRTGCFTHGSELWWLGASPDSSGLPLLKAIHAQLLCRLLEEGFSADTKPFKAHITLGREIKHTKPILLDCPEITVQVDHISLMKSEHLRTGLIYTELMRKCF